MKIIKKGKAEPAAVRFKCVWCGSILEAGMDELTPDSFCRNEQFYAFNCPVCMKERVISERDWKAVKAEDDE